MQQISDIQIGQKIVVKWNLFINWRQTSSKEITKKILWYVFTIAIFYSTPPVLFWQSRTMDMQATVFTNLSLSFIMLYAEQTISKWLQIYFMKYIHNQRRGLEDTFERMPQTYLLLACGSILWIQLTHSSFSFFSLLFSDFIYLFYVRLLENNKKRKSIV